MWDLSRRVFPGAGAASYKRKLRRKFFAYQRSHLPRWREPAAAGLPESPSLPCVVFTCFGSTASVNRGTSSAGGPCWPRLTATQLAPRSSNGNLRSRQAFLKGTLVPWRSLGLRPQSQQDSRSRRSHGSFLSVRGLPPCPLALLAGAGQRGRALGQSLPHPMSTVLPKPYFNLYGSGYCLA